MKGHFCCSKVCSGPMKRILSCLTGKKKQPSSGDPVYLQCSPGNLKFILPPGVPNPINNLKQDWVYAQQSFQQSQTRQSSVLDNSWGLKGIGRPGWRERNGKDCGREHGEEGLERGEEMLSGEMERNVQNSGGMAEGIAVTEMRLREWENKRAVKYKIWT